MTTQSGGGERQAVWRDRLASREPRGFTPTGTGRPIIWERAQGTHVWDVDGRCYLDLTAAFGVAAVGHAHPRVVAAVQAQVEQLPHAMADVYPARVKIELLDAIAALAPGDLDAAYLGLSGADAVEAAIKIAMLTTGRRRVIHFDGAYHGLSYGALTVCGRDAFRAPFAPQLGDIMRRAPFPLDDDPATHHRSPTDFRRSADFHVIEQLIAGGDTGAVIVEPIQGRGGIRIPPAGLLIALRAACTEHGALLIADEIWTGLGRTGRWFAVDHEEVVPDLLLIGKSLGGGLPISACIGRREAMGEWSTGGEAMHTSTFSGHPTAAAAAIAVLAILDEEDLVPRAADLGHRALNRLREQLGGVPGVAAVRGRGLMLGIELRTHAGGAGGDAAPSSHGAPDSARAASLIEQALARGVLILAGGAHANVIELSPPLTIPRAELDAGLDLLIELLRETPPTRTEPRP